MGGGFVGGGVVSVFRWGGVRTSMCAVDRLDGCGCQWGEDGCSRCWGEVGWYKHLWIEAGVEILNGMKEGRKMMDRV